jgi:ribosomal protein S18 acetylase RimI-like enzyme
MREDVQLRPMTESEFREQLEATAVDYAREKVRAGHYEPGGAVERAREEIARVVPEGLRTPGHHAAFIVPPGGSDPVGWVWYGVREDGGRPALFIWELRVFEGHRRRGHAEAALAALEPRARELGAERISLHVFAHNGPARALYEKVGYEVRDLWMTKSVPAS